MRETTNQPRACAADERVWDRLALYGGPLFTLERSLEEPSSDRLAEVIEAARDSLERFPEQADAARKREALRHFVFAVRHDFPTRFRQLQTEVPDIDAWLPESLTGRLIKHKRISARTMVRYL